MVELNLDELGLVYGILVLSVLLPAFYECWRSAVKSGFMGKVIVTLLRGGVMLLIVGVTVMLGVIEVWRLMRLRFALLRISLMSCYR